MHLYLTNHSHLNTSYTNEEGQILYRVETQGYFNKVSTISRVVPNNSVNKKKPSLQDEFGELGRVEFHTLSPSVLRFGGRRHETNTFFSKKGLSGYGRNHAFTGPDGREYMWKLGLKVPELLINNDDQTPVATFHRGRFGIFRKSQPASLEIYPEGMHMLDLIMVTFVYIQKLRNDREGQSGFDGGGGGDGGGGDGGGGGGE
ncbi:hypothetical protein AMATHDRAFT_137257 [Amanita thiersii Skay4041]|uniref:DUF6593 domain-containing protein n=1 Tax=Amanita thiersii Skay4041 TaxID=703135 RepID=A0A2A9NRD2_9AGAR|nr:hypothetical protein AMATHDRAFT_137257 [Amanita thiersii Skay4041]